MARMEVGRQTENMSSLNQRRIYQYRRALEENFGDCETHWSDRNTLHLNSAGLNIYLNNL